MPRGSALRRCAMGCARARGARPAKKAKPLKALLSLEVSIAASNKSFKILVARGPIAHRDSDGNEGHQYLLLSIDSFLVYGAAHAPNAKLLKR